MTMNNMYTNLPALIAHRGASAQAPENTLAAFNLAADLGATWLELDVTISQDGIAVIHHDAELERCTNGHGLVIQHSLEELKALDSGSWFAPQFHQERIMTLAELLSLANQRTLGLNIEIKPTLGREHETVQAIAQAMQEVPPRTPILFSSFNPYALQAALIHLPNIPRALCTEAIPLDWAERLNHLHAIGLHFQADFFTEATVSPLLNAGIGLAVFTVNNTEQAKRILHSGVHAMFSDYPNLPLS